MSDSYNDDLGTRSRRYESKYVDYTKYNNGIVDTDNDLKIIAVQKEVDGEVKAYKLSDGQIVTVQKAIDLCNMGALPDYITVTRWDGDGYIRTRPNSKRADNLSNLPEF